MTKQTPDERLARLRTGHCCWHCRHYIRPLSLPILDGPATELCTVDRLPGVYPLDTTPTYGDVHRNPDESCIKFEMELPPSPMRGLR